MTRSVMIVAALLLTNLASEAAAAENPEHKSKHAQKILATLEMLGINSTEVKTMIAAVDDRVKIKRGYAYLAQTETVGGQALGGKLSLRYKLNGKPGIKRAEIHYANDDYPVEFVARTNIVRISYHIEF